ncbi:hypothetical protein [Proteus vulgaris]|uniref:hypothetical protein n=1 Tax=Proteus vulgaris TaxID=585 RepID=UPI00065A632B|nr:hypothetical protein [Proteus vulgaris]CRL65442.1 hypothetical protein BN1805_03356 [Proteus vulgaris]
MQKEIGGYFELESLVNKPWYENNIRLNSGRSALLLLIKIYNIKKLLLPYFLCNSVKEYLHKNISNIKINYYYIDSNFLPIIEEVENSFLYIVNYYGFISNKTIVKYKNKYKNIIVDNTQAFFQPPISNVPTLYSCRKYFGIPDGAYLFCNKAISNSFNDTKIKDVLIPLIGRGEECASNYYKQHINCEEKIANIPIQSMSKFSENILGAIDYEKIIIKRNTNFSYLHKNLSHINSLEILKNTIPDAPFCYPLLIKNSDNLKKHLIKNKIYIPTLWPNVLEECDKSSIEYNYTKNILPIPCDQRYDINDMNIIINMIAKYKV